jgi:hypothetical protein
MKTKKNNSLKGAIKPPPIAPTLGQQIDALPDDSKLVIRDVITNLIGSLEVANHDKVLVLRSPGQDPEGQPTRTMVIITTSRSVAPFTGDASQNAAEGKDAGTVPNQN